MAAIEGFELSISTGDVVVANGMIDGVAVEGAQIDAAALGDGTALVVYTGSALALKTLANRLATDTVLGSVTVATGAVTATSMAYRGTDAPVSSNE